jgi:hypothetical protein
MITVAATTFKPWAQYRQFTSMRILGPTRIPILMPVLLFITLILLRLIHGIDLHLVPIFPISPIVVAVPVIVTNSPKAYRQGNKLCTALHTPKEKDRDVMITMSMWGPRENIMPMTIASHITNCHLELSLLTDGLQTDFTPTSVWVLIIAGRVRMTGVANRSAKVIGN